MKKEWRMPRNPKGVLYCFGEEEVVLGNISVADESFVMKEASLSTLLKEHPF